MSKIESVGQELVVKLEGDKKDYQAFLKVLAEEVLGKPFSDSGMAYRVVTVVDEEKKLQGFKLCFNFFKANHGQVPDIEIELPLEFRESLPKKLPAQSPLKPKQS